jgi:hypothetical protein
MGTEFKKQRHCPSSQVLVSYHQHNLATWQTSPVTSHLAKCDFCAAELQLLSKFSLAEPCNESPVMPAHLRALARALLTRDSLLLSGVVANGRKSSAGLAFGKAPLGSGDGQLDI